MSNSRRNKRIDKKKAAEQVLGTDPNALSILLDLAQENPGQPLRGYIRKRVKEILAANPERTELLVDVDEILGVLTEFRLRKERLLKAKKDPKVPPFLIPSEFVGKFRWVYKLNRQSEVLWQLIQA